MPSPLTLLLVESDEDDYKFIRAALRDSAPDVKLKLAYNGADACAYLAGEDGYADRTFFPLPDVVIIDAKAPRAGGLNFVRWLREQSEHRHLPVLVLSCSLHREDVERAHASGADAYFAKPISRAKLAELFGSIVRHWGATHDRSASWPGAMEMAAHQAA